MCGIIVWCVDHESSEIKSLAHRGPDGSCTKSFGPNGKLTFVFHRLAIVCLDEAGMQPFENEMSMLVCNGEIYNYEKLEREIDAKNKEINEKKTRETAEINGTKVGTDETNGTNGETAETNGTGETAEINGTTVGTDETKETNGTNGNGETAETKVDAHGTLQMRSDVEVIHHLLKDEDLSRPTQRLSALISKLDGDYAFVYANSTGLLVARDPVGVKPLFYGVDNAGDAVAFASEAKALYSAKEIVEVRVFPPGTFLCIPEQEYNKRDEKAKHIRGIRGIRGIRRALEFHPIDDTESRVRELLERSVEKRLHHSDREIGLLCSGGVDSAIITSLAARMLSSTTNIHVFTMQYDTGASEDAFYAKMLCEKHNFKHTVVTFGLADVQGCIREVIRACETYDPNTIRAAIPMYLLARYISRETDVKVVLSGEGADEIFSGYLYFKQVPDGDALNAESRRLVSNLHMFDLLRAERCFSAFGLEVRVPYLDHALVEYVLGLDGRRKMFRGSAEKMLLRDAFRDLEDLKELRILDRPKEKFSDGCGFSYVPQLLNHVTSVGEGGEGANEMSYKLDEKLKAEKAFYKGIFVDIYGLESLRWIVDRDMPEWVAGNGGARNGEVGCV